MEIQEKEIKRVKQQEEREGLEKVSGNTKNYNLEVIRMISFIFVVVIHVTNYFCRAYGNISDGEYLFSLALDTLARISVPSFFMISGALLLGRDEPLKKHAGRLWKFLLALAVWSAVYYFWNVYYMGTGYDLRELLYVPTEPHLWYLYAMIPIYLVLPFFQVMCRGMERRLEYAFLIVISAAVLFNYVVSLQNGEAYYDLPLIGDRVYTFYIFIGYYLYKYRNEIRIGQKGAAVIFAISMAAAFFITWAVTAGSGDHYERVLEYGCPLIVIASAACFLFVIRIKNAKLTLKGRVRKVVDTCCSCSFGIYLIHILFLDNYKKYMEPEDVSAWIAVPALVTGILIASFVCIWVLRRVKPFRAIM